MVLINTAPESFTQNQDLCCLCSLTPLTMTHLKRSSDKETFIPWNKLKSELRKKTQNLSNEKVGSFKQARNSVKKVIFYVQFLLS